MTEPYDITVIGGGVGGYVAAIRAAQLGARVALVERERIGGTCLNRGCIPTKSMLYDAHLVSQVTSGDFCLEAEGGWRVNYAKLLARKRRVVDGLVGGIERLLRSQRIEVLAGTGRIVRPGLVVVTGPGSDGAPATQEIACRAIIIASGSVPAPVAIPGTDLPGVLTSDEILEIETLPERLVIIGASVVGVEFACLFNALGVRVTMLERQVMLRECEQQLVKRLRALLTRQGIAINLSVEPEVIECPPAGALCVPYTDGDQHERARGDLVLQATGRWPYTAGLGLQELGVAMDGRAIKVDEHLQTSVPGIYAIGDCIGGHMLAHVASYEGEVAAENVMGRPRRMDYTVVPNCVYCFPELADVGLTEAEAKETGQPYVVSRFPFNVSGRALSLGEAEGQVRIICADDGAGRGGRVLGVHILGPSAGELIGEASLAMHMGATAADIAETIHAHPTLGEALREAALGQRDGAIHFQQRGER
ncbi:MAG: dihydrolipoyl dehydrogenase [Chloroflexi bacterium]|nr:dihydrolipoyl dehydrogenase [Chloroflexota bacterium]